MKIEISAKGGSDNELLHPLGAQCAVALEARIKKVVESHGIKPIIGEEMETR